MGDARNGTTGRTREPDELGPQGRRTRARLLDAGRTVLGRQGYHGTRVDDIVELAGTSHGTFYLYFANLEELLGVLREEFDAAIGELAEGLPALAAGDDGLAAFRDWIERFDGLYLQHGGVIAAHLESTRRTGGEAFEVYTALQTRLADAIESAGCEVAAEIAAMAIIAMLERFAFFSPASEMNGERDRALDTLATLSHAGLFS